MSIDEVMLVAEDYSMAVHDGRDADCGRLHKALRTAIEQHVAEEVAKEREACAKVCDAIEDKFYEREGRKAPELRTDATTGAGACGYTIRARAEKETT